MPYIGEIRIFTGDFAPIYWALCDGSILPIQQNANLYSILGTYYGGDGRTTFCLPDLRGRAPLHQGSLMGNNYTWGMRMGAEQMSIFPSQLPSHAHKISGSVYQPVLGENPGKLSSPDNAYMAITNGQQVYSTVKHTTNRMAPLKVSMQVQYAGGGQAMNNMQPFLPLNFIICIQGNFPPRP